MLQHKLRTVPIGKLKKIKTDISNVQSIAHFKLKVYLLYQNQGMALQLVIIT